MKNQQIAICTLDEDDNIIKFEKIMSGWSISTDKPKKLMSKDLKKEMISTLKDIIIKDLDIRPVLENLLFEEGE